MLLSNSVYCENNILKLPSNISQRLYCFSCLATVTEIEKVLSKRRTTKQNRTSKVEEVVGNICKPNNFLSYEYSPPKTVSACDYLLEEHQDEIENAFVKERKGLQKYICETISQACEGIDTKEERSPVHNADIDLGAAGGSKTIQINSKTGKAEVEKKKSKKEAKTISKKSKKSKKEKKGSAQKKTKKDVASNEGVQKGSLHRLNLDLNDPSSMEAVMKQIQYIANQPLDNQANKDEL